MVSTDITWGWPCYCWVTLKILTPHEASDSVQVRRRKNAMLPPGGDGSSGSPHTTWSPLMVQEGGGHCCRPAEINGLASHSAFSDTTPVGGMGRELKYLIIAWQGWKSRLSIPLLLTWMDVKTEPPNEFCGSIKQAMKGRPYIAVMDYWWSSPLLDLNIRLGVTPSSSELSPCFSFSLSLHDTHSHS